MPFVQVNGIELYYELHGSGPPLVFAHGSGGNHLSWWQQIPFFSQWYTCIVFDHRSFGFSHDSSESQGRRAFADDIKGLLDHLKVEQAAIVAQSMGGRTGVGFTIRNPGRVKALVLCGSNGGSVNEESYRVRQERQENHRPLPAGAVRALSPGFTAREPEKTLLYKMIMHLNPRHSADFLAAPPGYRGSTSGRLAETGVPILYMVGEEDMVTSPRIIEIAASLIPSARFMQVPDTGHSVYFEKPELFNKVVLEFLREAHVPNTPIPADKG